MINVANRPIQIFTSIIVLSVLFYACDNQSVQSYDLETSDAVIIESPANFSDSSIFEKVKQYIEKKGIHEGLRTSGMESDTSWMVDYYRIEKDGWVITKDHHTRIYFSYENHSYGNIFLEHDSVRVEPNYLGPKEQIDTLTEIVLPINRLYIELVEEALKE